MNTDDAPLTSRSPGREMHERPGNFGECTGANEVPMQEVPDPVSSGKPPSSTLPLLFRVFNAITGTRTEPAVHHMPSDLRHVLQHLANRADNATGIARGANESLVTATGLGASTVRRALAELLEHRCITRAGTYGPPGREQPCFMVHDGGWIPWPEPIAKRREPPPRPAPLSAADPCQSGRPGVSAGQPPVSLTPHPCQPDTPGVSAVHPRGVSGGDSPPILPPRLPPSDPPPLIAHARDHAQEIPKGQAVLFTPSEPPIPGTRVQRKKPPKGSAKPAPVERAEDRYARAVERAHRDAGFPVSPLTKNEKALLGPIASVHARYRDGTAITGDELVQWFYRRTRAFRVDVLDPSRHRGGSSPYGFRSWLDNGADGEDAPLAPGQDEPDEAGELPFVPEELREAPPPVPPEGLARARATIARFLGKEAANG